MSDSTPQTAPNLSKKFSREQPSISMHESVSFDPTKDDDFKGGAVDLETINDEEEGSIIDLNQDFRELYRLNSTLDEGDQSRASTISWLIDFKRVSVGLCPSGDQEFDEETDEAIQCAECEKKVAEYGQDLHMMRCIGCHKRETPNPFICGACRMVWLEHWRKVFDVNDQKRKIIARQLRAQPDLSLDLLCDLPTKAGLAKLINDIEMMGGKNRNQYALFLIDLDNLKAINSSLGHDVADKIIMDVCSILKEYGDKVRNGGYSNLNGVPPSIPFLNCYVFRQGGDEFAMIVHCKDDAKNTSFMNFYMEWRDAINGLAKKYRFNDLNEDQMEKGVNAIRERKKNALSTVLDGLVDVDYGNIEQAIDNQEINFSMEKIGVSVGIFIPNVENNKIADWIQNAEKARDAAKAIEGKNNIAIFYGDEGVLSKEMTRGCLQTSVVAVTAVPAPPPPVIDFTFDQFDEAPSSG